MIDAPADARLPRWFAVGLRSALAALLCYSVVGVLLAMAGWFWPVPVLVLTAASTGALVWRTADRGSASAATPWDHLVAGLVVAGVVAVTGWNLAHHAEHLVIERDPAVYLTTARWLVDAGDLHVEGLSGPFAGSAVVYPNGPGFSPQPDGTLAPQFPHLLPTVAAAAGWVDPSLLTLVNPVLAGLALLCVFAAASTVTRLLWAAAATGLTAMAFPFVLMARDLYSEPLAMALVFGGIWVLVSSSHHRPARGVLAGGLLGATCMVRIDGLVSMVPLAAVLGAALYQSIAVRDGRRVRWLLLVGSSVAVTAAIGVFDTRRFSPGYFHSDLAPRLPALVGAAIAAAIAAFCCSPLLWHTGSDDGADRADGPTSLLRFLTAVGTAGLLGLFAWMATVRPSTAGIPALAADATGRVLDLLDELRSLTYRWLEWYLGRPGTAAGLTALVGLAAWALLRARDRLALALPGMVLATTVLYLWSPNITPDQPWAMRRFLAVSIPGLLVALAWALGCAWDWRPPRLGALRAVGPVAAVALLGATAVATGATTRPLRDVEVGRGSLEVIDSLCEVAAEEPSAVLVAPEALFNLTLPQAVRAWCGVPAGGASPDATAEDVLALADSWAREGRRLIVVSASGEPFGGLGVPATALPTAALEAAEMTLTREPERLVPDTRLVPGTGMLRLQVQVIDGRER